MMLKINGITTLSRCDLYLTDKVCDWRIGTWWVSGVFSGELNKMLSVQLSYKTHQFGEAGNKLYEFRDSTPLLTLIICKKNNTFIFRHVSLEMRVHRSPVMYHTSLAMLVSNWGNAYSKSAELGWNSMHYFGPWSRNRSVGTILDDQLLTP